MKRTAAHRCFDGVVGYYSHAADTTQCDMGFSVFVPDSVTHPGPRPVFWWLSGLTCTAENFTTKAGAFRAAAEAGVLVVAPDTSPRGDDVPDDEAYDLGQGAGFYVDATQAPWSTHFNMFSYVVDELPALIADEFDADMEDQRIAGHSMGGHGALVIALRRPGRFRQVSAFAPIVNPCEVPWGRKAFGAYLGDDREQWKQYDACELMQRAGDRSTEPEIVVEQGTADPFLGEQLQPEVFAEVCAGVGQKLSLRRRDGYDHSYFTIATFIGDIVRPL